MITMVSNGKEFKKKSLVFYDRIWHLTPLVAPFIVFLPSDMNKSLLLGKEGLVASFINKSLKGSLLDPSIVVSGKNVTNDVKLESTWKVTIEKQTMSSNNNHVSSSSSKKSRVQTTVGGYPVW